MNRLKELRKRKKDTQAELANLMGVNAKTISRWEKGEFEIKPAQAKMLAEHFNISISYLMGYSDKKEPYYSDEILIGDGQGGYTSLSSEPENE